MPNQAGRAFRILRQVSPDRPVDPVSEAPHRRPSVQHASGEFPRSSFVDGSVLRVNGRAIPSSSWHAEISDGPADVEAIQLRVDRDRELLGFLSAHLGIEGLEYLVPPRPFAQGMFSDVVSFRLNRGPAEWTVPLVLRMLPLDAEPEQPALETTVQNGLARIGWPAPHRPAESRPDRADGPHVHRDGAMPRTPEPQRRPVGSLRAGSAQTRDQVAGDAGPDRPGSPRVRCGLGTRRGRVPWAAEGPAFP